MASGLCRGGEGLRLGEAKDESRQEDEEGEEAGDEAGLAAPPVART